MRRTIRVMIVMTLFPATRAAVGSTITFQPTGQIVTYVVPSTGLYDILAVGASGGSAESLFTYQQVPGGPGASVEDFFRLTAGEQLSILVGETSYEGQYGAGGGGGASYIVAPGTIPLLVAGGGGGAAYTEFNGNFTGPCSTLVETGPYAGGGSGEAYGTTDFHGGGGGGAGFLTNGGTNPAAPGNSGFGGNSFINGGAGGMGGYHGVYGGDGGFGGGGGGNTGGDSPGGGGSFSNGDSFDDSSNPIFNPNANPAVPFFGTNGYVTITSVVPEPISVGFMALASTALCRRRTNNRVISNARAATI